MALSKDDKVEILKVGLSLDDDNFQAALQDLNNNVGTKALGDLVKKFAVLSDASKSLKMDLTDVLATNVTQGCKTAEEAIDRLQNKLVDLAKQSGTTLSFDKLTASMDKAYTMFGKETRKITAPNLKDIVYDKDNPSNTSFPTKIVSDLFPSAAGNQFIKTIKAQIAKGVSYDDISSKYGKGISDLLRTQGGQATDRQMVEALASIDKNFEAIDVFGNNTVEKTKYINDILRKLNPSATELDTLLSEFQNKMGDTLTQLQWWYNKQGKLMGMKYTAQLDDKTVSGTVNRKQMSALWNEAQKGDEESVPAWLRGNSTRVSQRLKNSESAQLTEYKKLLTEQYEIEQKIENAEISKNEQLKIEYQRQLDINKARQDSLNNYRTSQGRNSLDQNAGVKELQAELDSYRNINSARNSEKKQYLADEEAKKQAAQTETKNLNKIISLENERFSNWKNQNTAKIQGNEREAATYEINIKKLEKEISTRRMALSQESVTKFKEVETANQNSQSIISARNDDRAEEEKLNKLISLENQRFDLKKRIRVAKAQDNKQEVAELAKLLSENEKAYQAELNRGIQLSQASSDYIKQCHTENEEVLKIIKARERDLAIQKQQETEYVSLSSNIKSYVALLKEKSSLELQGANKQGNIANASYNLVNQRLGDLQAKQPFTVQSDGNLQLKSQSELNVSVEQYKKLLDLVQKVNQELTDDRVATKQKQEEQTVAKLIALEKERYSLWQKSHAATMKGNTGEADKYANSARAKSGEYSDLYNKSTLSDSSKQLVKELQDENFAQQQLTLTREKDEKARAQQISSYEKMTSSISNYLSLYKQQQQLISQGANADNSIYNNTFNDVSRRLQNVIDPVSAKAVSFTDGKFNLAEYNETLGITIDQWKKLKLAVDSANQTIQNDANAVKQQQQLTIINQLVAAYTNLVQEEANLQRLKDGNYSEAAINTQRATVVALQQQFESMKANNSVLVSSAEYTKTLSEAQQRLNANVSRSNNTVVTQMTFLQRLRSNLQRTASVALNFNLFNRALMKLRQGLMDIVTTTKEFDKTMTDIQMVTNQTDTQVKNLLASYSDLAKQLGVTTQTVADSNLEWLKFRSRKTLLIAGKS